MAGTIPLALTQQVDINGQPLAGCLLYFYQVGTVATLQNSYQDFGLTIANPNPLVADQTGRIPMFWLADGQVHARLTDASGVVILDTIMQVLGPSSGGGGGGGSGVDPTSLSTTGDVKWRPTNDTISGWVKANDLTIGNATSGATQRANADTQNLFVYLWNAATAIAASIGVPASEVLVVSGGYGASALADFNAGKTIATWGMRGRIPCGLDGMGNVLAGVVPASNIAWIGTATADTPYALGGEANHTLDINEMPSHPHGVNDGFHDHQTMVNVLPGGAGLGAGPSGTFPPTNNSGGQNWVSSSSGSNISIQNNGGGASHNNMSPFRMGTFYIKL